MTKPYNIVVPVKPEGVEPHELRELSIVKQAILKSLIEAGAIKERTKEAEKLVLDWVSFTRRNGKVDKEAWEPLPF